MAVPLIARSFPRLYDRQLMRLTYARLQGAAILPVTTVDDVITAVEYLLQTEYVKPYRPVEFTNGVQPALEAIRAALKGRSLMQ
ncbi:MAG: hypothetical protein AAFW75_20815 [Cyanobacteria bacterium J06636_16]